MSDADEPPANQNKPWAWEDLLQLVYMDQCRHVDFLVIGRILGRSRRSANIKMCNIRNDPYAFKEWTDHVKEHRQQLTARLDQQIEAELEKRRMEIQNAHTGKKGGCSLRTLGNVIGSESPSIAGPSSESMPAAQTTRSTSLGIPAPIASVATLELTPGFPPPYPSFPNTSRPQTSYSRGIPAPTASFTTPRPTASFSSASNIPNSETPNIAGLSFEAMPAPQTSSSASVPNFAAPLGLTTAFPSFHVANVPGSETRTFPAGPSADIVVSAAMPESIDFMGGDASTAPEAMSTTTSDPAEDPFTTFERNIIENGFGVPYSPNNGEWDGSE